MEKINNLLTDEILATILTDKEAGHVILGHLDATFLPTKEHQDIHQAIRHCVFKDGSASWGTAYEVLKNNKPALELLMNMKTKEVSPKAVISGLESFLIDKKFRQVYEKQGQIYKQGKVDKLEEVRETISDYLSYCNSLSLNSEMVKGLIEEIDESEEERTKRKSLTPLSTGIAPLDYYTFGGIRNTELWLLMADSGGGKSTCLRYIGIQALLQGKRVLHFQAEDSRQACIDLYKSTLFEVNSSRFQFNKLDDKTNKEIAEKVQEFKKTVMSDLYVVAFEEFGSASLLDCYQHIKKLEKKYGKFDLILFDYLDEFEAGDGKTYSTSNDGERARKSAVVKQMKNIALEFDTRVITATQSHDIKTEDKNNPSFVLKRENIAENKALVRRVNLFFTINQTYSELDSKDRGYEIARIFIDKYRSGKDKVNFTIAQGRDRSQFYLRKETLDMYWDESNKQPKIYV